MPAEKIVSVSADGKCMRPICIWVCASAYVIIKCYVDSVEFDISFKTLLLMIFVVTLQYGQSHGKASKLHIFYILTNTSLYMLFLVVIWWRHFWIVVSGIVVEPPKARNRYGMWMSRLKTTIVYVFESIIALAGTYLCVRHFLSPAAAVAALYDREYIYVHINESKGDNYIVFLYVVCVLMSYILASARF